MQVLFGVWGGDSFNYLYLSVKNGLMLGLQARTPNTLLFLDIISQRTAGATNTPGKPSLCCVSFMAAVHTVRNLLRLHYVKEVSARFRIDLQVSADFVLSHGVTSH